MFSSPVPVSDLSASQAHRDVALPKNVRSYCSPGEAEITGTEMFGKSGFASYPACPIIQNIWDTSAGKKADPSLEGKQDVNW